MRTKTKATRKKFLPKWRERRIIQVVFEMQVKKMIEEGDRIAETICSSRIGNPELVEFLGFRHILPIFEMSPPPRMRLSQQQVDTIVEWMNGWDQLRGTSIPLRFIEDFGHR